MNDRENRLVDCFSVVFPKRSREEIPSASRDSFAEWDSLAGITLITLVQEEFQIEIDLMEMELEMLGSFPIFLQYVSERAGDEKHHAG
jgi:acyl carrier protein